jgi:hypothetical protein
MHLDDGAPPVIVLRCVPYVDTARLALARNAACGAERA